MNAFFFVAICLFLNMNIYQVHTTELTQNKLSKNNEKHNALYNHSNTYH